MKKILALALMLLLLLALPCAPVLAEAAKREIYESGDFRYALLEDGTAEITGFKVRVEELAIPAELDGHTVAAIGNGAFWNCDSMTTITIPDSVTTIGYNPFMSCKSLSRISVSPDHPTLAVIDGVLFSKADKQLVTYPNGFTQTEYAIPQGIEIIGKKAFYMCDSLTTVTIPNSVTTIGDGAFCGCRLVEITIPNSVTTIGDEAFSGCELVEITIPDSVTIIGDNPFFRCKSLSRISVSPDHPTLAVIDGVLFSRADKRLVTYPCTFTQTEYAIPQGTEVIGNAAFLSCYCLTAIMIPDSVTTISDSAFSWCENLTTVTIPDGVTAIGDAAFSNCSSLTTITIPDSVTIIDDRAFYGCSSLTTVKIPYSVTTISDSAFSWCENLTTVTIPDSVTAIGKDAFSYCSSLTSIVVGQDSYAKQYCIDNNLPYTYANANDWLNQ